MKRFKALYTKHKTQKKKVFCDGFVEYNPQYKKASLYDESNKFIESTFCNKEPQCGDRLETDSFLVDLEEEVTENETSTSAPSATPPPASTVTGIKKTPTPLIRANAKPLMKLKPLHPSKPKTPIANPKSSQLPKMQTLVDNNQITSNTHCDTTASQPAPQELKDDLDDNSTEALQRKLLQELLEMQQAQTSSVPPPTRPPPPRPPISQTSQPTLSQTTQSQQLPFFQRYDDFERKFAVAVSVLQATKVPIDKDASSRPSASLFSAEDIARELGLTAERTQVSFKPFSPPTIDEFGEPIDDNEPEKSNGVSPLLASRKRSASYSQASDDFEMAIQRGLANEAPNKRPKPAETSPQAFKPSYPITKPNPTAQIRTNIFSRGFLAPQQVISKVSKWYDDWLCFPDPDTCRDLFADKRGPKRTKVIPDRFNSLNEYASTWSAAVREEMNIKLAAVAKQFHDCYAAIKKPEDGVLLKQHQQTFRSRNSVELYLYMEVKKGYTKRGRPGSSSERQKTSPIYIALGDDKGHHSKYQKGDIWVISSTTSFNPKIPGEMLVLARSVVHGPSSSGLLEIELLDNPSVRLAESQTMHCINCGNFSTELSILDAIAELEPAQLPVLTPLLGGFEVLPSPTGQKLTPPEIRLKIGPIWPRMTLGQVTVPLELVEAVKQEILATYPLNIDQRAVLDYCSRWLLTPKSNSISPVLLVHGVFGSGKSHMLCVVIIFLHTVLSRLNDTQTRILVSSLTNVAVDRILVGLLEFNFRDFMRIGSFAKINKMLIPFTLHPHSSSAKATYELEMLASTKVGVERENILQYIEEIKNVKSQAEKVKRLTTVRVVGVTCAATVFDALAGHKFPIVILDECSQMIEPVSLLPIGKFGCEKLLMVGDPLQLPPQLSSYVAPDSLAATKGLGRTLFSRLSDTGLTPILLRTQYRLHPLLSSIVNELFYRNQLLDGVSAAERAPLLPELPTLAFYDTMEIAEEMKDQQQSIYNPFETEFVVKLLQCLIARQIAGSTIGVICLYKAQEMSIVNKIKPEIDKANEEFAKKPKKVKKPKKRKPRKSSHRVSLIDDEAEEAESDEAEEEVEQEDSTEDSLRVFDPRKELASVQVSTVDAFQGAEKEVIIVSTSRTHDVGFTEFANRVNVALTRAKRHLLIVGSAQCLRKSSIWSVVVKKAIETSGSISAPAVIDNPI